MRQQNINQEVRLFGTIDDLTLSYDGNQLVKVTDGCDELSYAGAMDFKDGSDAQTEYTWDANGNMTKDLNKGISRIRYNELNLPSVITYSDGHSVNYTYAADGRKLRADYLVVVVGTLPGNRGIGDHNLDPPPSPGGGWIPLDPDHVLLRLDYCGDHVYRNGSLERTLNDYGYLSDSTYYYYIKDYQGNVRAVINQAGVLKEVNNYYPYGGLMGAATAGVQPLKYGGKELDRENGIDWLDFGARYHDPMLPMFTTQDPLAEQTPSISPYAYCAGNPIRYIDPSGMLWLKSQWGDDTYYMFDKDINNESDIASKYGKDANLSLIGEDYDNLQVDIKYRDGDYAKRVLLGSDGTIQVEGNDVDEYNYSTAHFSNVSNYTFRSNFITKYLFGLKRNYFNSFYVGHMNPQINGRDSYSLPPINLLDYAAQQHDKDYDRMNAVGILGVLSMKTLPADLKLAQRSAFAAHCSDFGTKEQLDAVATTMLFNRIGFIKMEALGLWLLLSSFRL